MGQVITNLVENAINHAFHDRNTGRIAITAVQASEDIVTIELSDDGSGMTPDVARKAFDPFFTTALGRGGTGLSLYIVRRTVETVLGGTVALKSKSGKGTAFKLEFPVQAPTAENLRFGENMTVT